MSVRPAIAVILAVAALAGCRAYREKKAEFLRNDARSLPDPSARIRALVDADCFVEVGKAPADAPETNACRRVAGPKRLDEARKGASLHEATFYKAWSDCFAGSDGTLQQWSACERGAEAKAKAAMELKAAPPPAPPVVTSTTSTTS